MRHRQILETFKPDFRFVEILSVCTAHQHIDYANLHYTLKSNGIAYASTALPVINSQRFFVVQYRKIGSCVLCAVFVCEWVCVFTQVDWTFNIHHSNIASQSFYFIVFYRIPFWRIFFSPSHCWLLRLCHSVSFFCCVAMCIRM